MKRKSLLSRFVQRCDTCHGGGIVPGRCQEDEYIPCPTCKGKGILKHKKTKTHLQEQPCDNPNCVDGWITLKKIVDGREEPFVRPCPVCDGYGVMYREVGETATAIEKCPTCAGRAILSAEEMRKRHIEDLCPDCGGKGFHVNRTSMKIIGGLGVLALFEPAVFAVLGFFGFMLYSVKQVVLGKKHS